MHAKHLRDSFKYERVIFQHIVAIECILNTGRQAGRQ
jgi:hypothetical protein